MLYTIKRKDKETGQTEPVYSRNAPGFEVLFGSLEGAEQRCKELNQGANGCWYFVQVFDEDY